MESGINLELLSSKFGDRELFLWRDLIEQVEKKQMPPQQDFDEQLRNRFLESAGRAIHLARSRVQEKNGAVRRLTVAQYRHSLQQLFDTPEDFTETLPPDAVSRDGCTNNAELLGLSPLHLEHYLEIADRTLEGCLVDEGQLPVIQNFVMHLGKSVNPDPCPDRLILGANSRLLPNEDILVTELAPEKPFSYQPFEMQKSFRFIEGYQGNSTVRGWREFSGIYHAVFGCMRGSGDYPLGLSHEPSSNGLLLRSAIPSTEIFQESSTYGPQANFKIALRELPDSGLFQVRVKAAKYEDPLLLKENAKVDQSCLTESSHKLNAASGDLQVAKAGIYLIRIEAKLPQTLDESEKKKTDASKTANAKPPKPELLKLEVAGRLVSRNFRPSYFDPASTAGPTSLDMQPFCVMRLSKGSHPITAEVGGKANVTWIDVVRLAANTELEDRFLAFEKRHPQLAVYLGLRRDCGHTLKQVGDCIQVDDNELQEFVFEAAIDDFPRPFVEKNNVNYLAGVREITVRNEYTDGEEAPRLLLHSIEFEGPYLRSWPPASHRAALPKKQIKESEREYAIRALERFMKRAYRRSPTPKECEKALKSWTASLDKTGNADTALRDSLLVILTSPQFMLLTETSNSPKAEKLSEVELASKLSFFLWNSPPDRELLELAEYGKLSELVHQQTIRLMDDERFDRFIQQFSYEWLGLDKFEVVEIDRKKYPRLSKEIRVELLKEPAAFLRYLLEQNLSIRNLIQSDFVVVNEPLAQYYQLQTPVHSGFRFQPVNNGSSDLGGVLTQAAILSGLSDGQESNPVKRGAWFARRIIADPPDDPPPNVPDLEDTPGLDLSLRQRLEKHRNQDGCAKCHMGIDPWGVAFEAYDAAGLLKKQPTDASSTLPDGTLVTDLNDLRNYLSEQHFDRFVFSFLKHLSTYAVGRDLSYNEVLLLEERSKKLAEGECRARDLVHFIVASDIFMTK
ncbi:MAG: DUF1592 domain-containing protein [Planctomycetota bacterium]